VEAKAKAPGRAILCNLPGYTYCGQFCLDTMPGGSYVLLCGSGLRDTVGMRFCGDVAFRILSVIQVRTTLGWRPLSIYNYCSRTTMSIRRCWVRVHGEAG
jgi:hypothetical protein